MSGTSQNPYFSWKLPLADVAGFSQWDYIRLKGVPSPGVIKGAVDFERVNKWDKKVGKGTIGATPTYVGQPPAEGKITFQLWTAQHLAAWRDFAAMLQPSTVQTTASALSALDIYHPSLVEIGVKSILVPADKISPLKHVGKGLYEVTIEVTEFRPPPPTGTSVATPKTTTSDSEPTEAQKKATAFQQALLERTNLFGRLTKQMTRP